MRGPAGRYRPLLGVYCFQINPDRLQLLVVSDSQKKEVIREERILDRGKGLLNQG